MSRVEAGRAIGDRALSVAEGDLDEVPFGRSRFLRYLAGALTGYATASALRAAPAGAVHNPAPFPCYGYPECHCCNGRYCCNDCHAHSYSLGCPGGGQCWWACSFCTLYRCCDWHEIVGSRHSACICSGLIDYLGCC